MAGAIFKAGTSGPVTTGKVRTIADKEGTSVIVEGLYSDLAAAAPADYVPEGYDVESSTLSSEGNGLGRLDIKCIRYESATGAGDWGAVRTTFTVDLEAVQYDLEDHPSLTAERDKIIKWLATDPAQRWDNTAGKYQYADGESFTPIEPDEAAYKFCEAFMAGIKTFNRYFPVIEKVSVYKNPPGLTRAGRSFSGGSPKFSENLGTFDSPPLSLNGYPATNWFKSRDHWSENANGTWNRREQWTYTPEGSDGPHAWIYTAT